MADLVQSRGPTAAPGVPAEVPENVQALVEHTRELAGVDRDRTHHADTRAGGLAVLSNGLLAVAATLGPRLSSFTGASWIDSALPVAYGAALFLLLLAGASAAFALLLTGTPSFRATEVAEYGEARVQGVEPLSLQQRILSGWIAAVASERLTHDRKITHLRHGYVLFVGGLLGLIIVAVTLAEGGH